MRRIGPRTRRLLARAASQDALRVSTATLFEIAALHTLGRLRLTRGPGEWIREALAAGVRIAELTPAVGVDAGQIPRDALADPLDRLIVATACRLGAQLLTGDARILEYAADTFDLRVHDARG